MTLRPRPTYQNGDNRRHRDRPVRSAQRLLLVLGTSLAIMTLGAWTAFASATQRIDTVNLGRASSWATFQSTDHRIAVTRDGIFMAYLAAWNSKSHTGDTVIARSTDQGLSWHKLLVIRVTEHRPASLEADSAGNVYAVQPNVAGARADAYMYIFPQSRGFANDGRNYLALPQAGFGKFTTAYDPSTNELLYADHIDLFRIALRHTTASQDTYTEEDVFGTGRCGDWVEYPQIYVDRSARLILLAMTLSAKHKEWYEDRFMVSTDNGRTWIGRQGRVTRFPLRSGCSDDPTWLINPPSQLHGDSDEYWLDNAYAQDGQFLFVYSSKTAGPVEYRRFDWATKSFDLTIPFGRCFGLRGFCQKGLGGFFSGNGTPRSRIYYTTANTLTHDLYTIYSDDNGAQWHGLAKTAVPLGGCPYATSGTPTLTRDGQILGAVTALSHHHGYGGDDDKLVFFRTKIG